MKYIIRFGEVYLGTENGLVLSWVNNQEQAIQFSKEDMLTHVSTIADYPLQDLQITIIIVTNNS